MERSPFYNARFLRVRLGRLRSGGFHCLAAAGRVWLGGRHLTGTKTHKLYATPSGDCAPTPGSRMVTLIYPRLPVVHP
ncbi:hypothetical protein GCM10018780_75540 [Streptomyces lanatus]|nr:hypothetical protein GCM10018780_75540 [Streptomyces lanatus]